MPFENENILVLENISKEFPGVRALDNVSFCVKRNAVHALVGENGAGKSTLMKILTGQYTDYEGQIHYDGKPVKFQNERMSLDAGIAIVSQELNLVSEMTVAQNIYLGREFATRGILSQKKQEQQAEELLRSMDLNFKATDKIKDLSIAQRQLVEILKATSRNAKLVLMDEPTSALTGTEIEYLFKQIKRLNELGITIIYISHKLDEIFRVCSDITVLRDGCVVGHTNVREVDQAQLIAMMVGRPIDDIYPELPPRGTEPLFEVHNLYRKGEFEDVSFYLNRGEILGISGMMGAGRSEVAKAIFGLTQPDAGEILLEGEKLRIRRTRDAIEHGIVMVTEDRATHGFVKTQSIRDNILLANCDKYAPKLTVRYRELNRDVDEICQRLAVKAPSTQMLVEKLSGGNQQKVILAKWLIRNVKVLILDEPTRGIDVGAKHEIYKLIAYLAEQGIGIIVISSELPEVIGLSHRVLVMADGKIKGEIMHEDISQERIMATILAER